MSDSTLPRAISSARAIIQRNQERRTAYQDAVRVFAPLLRDRPSRQQLMHVSFIFSMTARADGDDGRAFEWLEAALALSQKLPRCDDEAELLYRRSGMYRILLKLDLAAADLHKHLALLDEQRDRRGWDDPAARLRARAPLATYQFFLGRLDESEQTTADARRLVEHAHASRFDAATLSWMEARLLRIRRRYDQAIQHLLIVADVYGHEASPTSQDRVQFDVAKTLIDYAAACPPGTQRNTLIAQALSHVERAERLAAAASDREGQGLAQLARAEYDRLAWNDVPRVDNIESVIAIADELDDVALRAQAYTALGDEYLARSRYGIALACYRTTLRALDGSSVSVLAIPAERARRWIEEMHPEVG